MAPADPDRCGSGGAGRADYRREVFRRHPSEFERLALPHLDAVYDLALHLSDTRTDADDLTQETFLKALAAFRRGGAIGSMKAWLFTILRHCALNRRRDAALHPCEPLEDEVAAEPAGEAFKWERLTAEDLEAIIPRLSCPAREAVVLRDLHHLSYKEIATVLACPVGTVMSRLHRGRAELRRLALERLGSAEQRHAG